MRTGARVVAQNPLDVRNFDNYGKDEGVLEYPETYPDDFSAFAEWGTEWV